MRRFALLITAVMLALALVSANPAGAAPDRAPAQVTNEASLWVCTYATDTFFPQGEVHGHFQLTDVVYRCYTWHWYYGCLRFLVWPDWYYGWVVVPDSLESLPPNDCT